MYFSFTKWVDNVGAVVRVSPIVSLSKVYVMRNMYEHIQKLQVGSLASRIYVTSRYLGYRASELSMRIWDRPQLRTCSFEALQLWGHPGMVLSLSFKRVPPIKTRLLYLKQSKFHHTNERTFIFRYAIIKIKIYT